MAQRQGLEPFIEAQAAYGYSQVVQELREGRKAGHWIWFIFPQLVGLGHSPRSTFFGIASLGEAAEYLSQPILGPRLRECTALMLSIQGRPASQILGGTDAMKFRSSMTLFRELERGAGPFEAALAKYFGGEGDQATLARLRSRATPLPS